MSDLSNLLGDLYGNQDDRDLDGPHVRHEPAADDRAPEWASTNRLDQAFESWTPEAHGAPRTSDDDLTAALSAALGGPTPAPQAPAPAPAPTLPSVMNDMPVAPAPPANAGWTTATPAAAPVTAAQMAHGGPSFWIRGDDDIFAGAAGRSKKSKKR